MTADQSLKLMATKKKCSETPSVRAPKTETPEEFARRLHGTRVEFVADMIREATFDPDRTLPALEREWNLSSGDVAEIVRQARRRVRLELTAAT